MGNIICEIRKKNYFKKYLSRYVSRKQEVKKLTKKEIKLLEENTGFDESVIQSWYEAFMVYIFRTYLLILRKNIFHS